MKTSPATHFLPPDALDSLRRLGHDIADARRRRGKRQVDVAAQALLSLATYRKVEAGDPTVAVGNYVSVLAVLGLLDGLSRLAAADQDPFAVTSASGPTRRVRRDRTDPVTDNDF